MSIRDLGMIELSVFAALFALFVVFFGLFVMLRHRKRVANSRNLLKKRARMEEAIRQKVRPARGKAGQGMRMLADESGMYRLEKEEAGQTREEKVEESGVYHLAGRKAESKREAKMPEDESENFTSSEQKETAGKVVVKKREGMRTAARRQAYVDFPGKRVGLSEEYGAEIAGKMESKQQELSKNETARLQRDGSVFVENRRISHRRDQLKRMEEAK